MIVQYTQTLNVIYHINKKKYISHCCVIDAEKAFGMIKHLFMILKKCFKNKDRRSVKQEDNCLLQKKTQLKFILKKNLYSNLKTISLSPENRLKSIISL